MKNNNSQAELFSTDTSWFHIFKEIIKSGAWAEMGQSAKVLYPVIKAFTNWKDGASFPSLDTLMRYSGLARASVVKALNELEALGYIEGDRHQGRASTYKLREKFEVKDHAGRPIASASFDYMPALVGETITELKNFVAKGMEGDGPTNIRIDTLNLTVNIENFIGRQNNWGDMDPHAICKGIRDRMDSLDTEESRAIEKLIDESSS